MTTPRTARCGLVRLLGTLIVNDIVFVRQQYAGADPIRIVTCRNAIAARASSVAMFATEPFQSNPSALSV
ncbi:hypothetical protein LMG19083_04340 [Ralstonia psammae]|uniref:Uncharacterized protein n=1 Tax=Ralstonia psammae TaxID=3058598 RepID=A0ABM9JWY2_9RALS|nr:hypothetical protein LMG19083_04340 [Ralstonia sp. LMG 19083]